MGSLIGFLPALLLVSFTVAHVNDEKCRVMIEGKFVEDPLLQIGSLADDAVFLTIDRLSSKAIEAVVCDRDSLIPRRNDYKVLVAGVPFAIGKDEKVLWLYLHEGELSFRYDVGVLSEEEFAAFEAWMDKSQTKINHALSIRRSEG